MAVVLVLVLVLVAADLTATIISEEGVAASIDSGAAVAVIETGNANSTKH